MRLPTLLLSLLLSAAALIAADPPGAEITNGQVRVKLYLPDPAAGFYRGTRFDWSGMIGSLEFAGHRFYGPWFQRTDPKVRDFAYEGAEIVAGLCSAAVGPAEEFLTDNKALGYDDAAPGGTFIKIGVGVLRRPDAAAYDRFKLYEIADPGKWSTRRAKDSVEFVQQVSDSSSGYGYSYTKTVRLPSGKPQMILEHRLVNTGKRPIVTRVYDHNFLTLDGDPPGPDFVISTPFEIKSERPPAPELAAIHGKRIEYLKVLSGQDRVTTPMLGFDASPAHNQVAVENTRTGASVRFEGDRPLVNLALWSIRAVLSAEPFIELSVQPGETATWRWTYTYRVRKP
jgi:hypothetical protein